LSNLSGGNGSSWKLIKASPGQLKNWGCF
jgi:hypothetical protein